MIKNIQFTLLDDVASTNIELIKEAQKNAPEGTTIVTNYQQTGRGQNNRTWQSEYGKNILLSTLLRPKISDISQLFMLNKAIAVAIARFTSNFINKNKIFIKWPNDIIIENRKIAGILIENSFTNTNINFSVVGIGYNVNQTAFPEYKPQATSLAAETNRNFPKNDLIYTLLSSIYREYENISSPKGIDKIDVAYHNKLYLKNCKSSYLFNGERIFLIPEKVNNYGQLIARDEKGNYRFFDAGSIKII